MSGSYYVKPNNQRIAKNTIFLYIRMIIVLLVSLYTVRIVLNTLGVVDYGIYNVVGGFVSMFGFLNTSMSSGIQRFYNYEMAKNGEQAATYVYNTALQIQIIVAFIILLAVELFGIWYLNNKMVIPIERIWTANWIFQLSVISLLIMIMQVPYSAAILAYERMDYYAIVSIVDIVIKLLIAIVLPYIQDDKLFYYGLLLLIINIVDFFLYYAYCKRIFSTIRFKPKVDIKRFKSMLSFSGWNTLGSFSYMLKGQGVNVLLNMYFGAAINAANGIASQISYAIQSFSISIVIAFKPQLTQSYAVGNYQRTTRIMFSMTKISYLLLYALSVPIIIEMEYILHIWLGETIPDYTSSFSILVIIIMLICSFNTPIMQVVHAVGKLKLYQICTSIIICSILPLSWFILWLGGNPMSVYWVSLAIVIINQIVCIGILHSIFIFSYRSYLFDIVVPCSIYTVILPLLPYVICSLMESSIIRLIIVCLVTLILSVIVAYILVLKHDEKEMLKSMINKILYRTD